MVVCHLETVSEYEVTASVNIHLYIIYSTLPMITY